MSTAANKPHLRTPEYWLALIAICVLSVCYYGPRAAVLLALAVVTCVLTDFFCLFLQNQSYRKANLSNVASAILLVLMLPASIPYSMVVISTVFAVAVGIHVFGSRGTYLFPPAAVGYLFALLWNKDAVLLAPQAGEYPMLNGSQNVIVESSVSGNFNAEGILPTGLFEILIGNVVSPMGTGCILLLAMILVVLLLRRAISYWACAGFLFGISLASVNGTTPALLYLTLNMVLFSMIFLVSDPLMIRNGRISALFGTTLTGMLTYYFMEVHSLEYAPVVAVMLTCPLWHLFAETGERIGQKLDEMELAYQKEKEAQMQEEPTMQAEVPHETE